MLESMGAAHQFGGAIALAWYRAPRATLDIDLNVTLAPDQAEPVLGAFGQLGIEVTASDRNDLAADGQVRLAWAQTDLDVFFATLEIHRRMAEWSRTVEFGPGTIPILAPEHLVVLKAVFDRPKDWVDIEAMVAWGTPLDRDEVLTWIRSLLGARSRPHSRLSRLIPKLRPGGNRSVS